MSTITSEPIHNAIKLIKQFPIKNHLTILYNQSSKNGLYFFGVISLFFTYKLTDNIKEKRQKLNAPPTVSFGLPFLGHSLYTLFIPTIFLDWCNKKYGEIYNLNIYGKVVTVTSGKSAHESLKAANTELSLDHGLLREIFHFHYVFEPKILDLGTRVISIIARVAVANSKMPSYIPCIENGLKTAIKELLPNDVNTFNEPDVFFQKFVSFMTVPVLLGDEFSSKREVIDSFGSFTSDMAKNIPTFLTLPAFLHQFILPYIQSPEKHQKIMKTHVAPVVLKHRKEMKLAKESGEEYKLEKTFLQGLIEFIDKDKDGNEFQYTENEISQAILMLAFVSAHTTASNLSFCIYWLLARPDLKEKLEAEIEDIAPGNTPISIEILNKMTFLNNFMREVLRQGSSYLGLNKLAMKNYTFANGYQIPKGRLVEPSIRQLNFGDNTTRLKINEMDPNMSYNKTVTTPEKDFVSFGMGKHVCPGRFFAVQEIKLSLIYLLKNFDIKTASGKRPNPTQRLTGIRVVCSKEPLVFTAKK